MLTDLRALDVPNALGSAFDAFVVKQEEMEGNPQQALAGAANPDTYNRALQARRPLQEEAEEIGARLGAQACADRLSAGEQQAVRVVVEEFHTSSDPRRTCGELLTADYAANGFGPQGCEGGQQGASTQPVQEVVEVSGVAGARANVVVVSGRPGDPPRLEFTLVYQEGSWRIASPPRPAEDSAESTQTPTDASGGAESSSGSAESPAVERLLEINQRLNAAVREFNERSDRAASFDQSDARSKQALEALFTALGI